MSITWGRPVADSSNAFRIGYEFSQSPASVAASTTSVTVTLRIYLATQYYAYDSSVNWDINGNIDDAGAVSFNHPSSSPWSSSNITLLATRSRTVNPSFSGSVNTSITAYVSGLAAIDGTASVSGTWTTSARPLSPPAGVTNTTLTRVSDTQTKIDWDVVSGTDTSRPAQAIEIERYDTDTGVYVDVVRMGVTSTYTASGQSADKRYYYRVRTTNTAGASAWSTAGPIYTTPNAPANVKATRSGNNIVVTWTDSSSRNDAFEVWRRINGVRDASPLATVNNGTGSYTHVTPTTSQKHSYEIRAKVNSTSGTGSLLSAFSPVSNGIQLTDNPPTVPTGVTPTTSTVTRPNPTLGGTLSAIATGQTQKMYWQFATNNTFTTNVINVEEPDADFRVSGSTTEAPAFSVLSLTNGTWYMRAAALDDNGVFGPWSATQTLTVNTPLVPTPTAITPASGTTITTMVPSLGATIGADTVGRTQKMEWQFATDSGFTANLRTELEDDADLRASGATTELLPPEQKLTLNGTWYLRARSRGQDGSVSAWTATQTITLALPLPPTPTQLLPVDVATIITDFPTLSSTLGAASEGRRVKAQWQIASDVAFTANLKTVTEVAGDLRTSGTTTESLTTAQALDQRTWYYRARALDEYDQPGAWTATQTFIVAHKPTASLTAPTGDVTLVYSGAVPFDWDFTDPERTDTQSAYQLVVERSDTGAGVLDTGKVTSTQSMTNAINATALLKDVKLRWRVKVWDSDDVASNWSAYQLFTLSDLPIVTISLPAVNQQIGTGQPTVNWSTDSQTVQAAFRVRIIRTSDGVLIHDSNTIASNLETYTTPGTILKNLVGYQAQVTITDVQGLSGSATNPFTTAYQSPDEVIYYAGSDDYERDGFINIDWSATQPDGFFVEWHVYRRQTGSNDWELLEVYNDFETTSHKDWTATTGDSWEYAVTQLGGRSGYVLESPINPEPQSVTADGTHYWLINPVENSNNLRLDIVTSDNFSDPYESAEMTVIGRGRKFNLGTRIGYDGTLVAQLRNDDFETARNKRRRLQQIKSSLTSYVLRNPFGDMFQISLGDLQFSRIAGVGTSEYVDVTIPYKEVF